MNTQAVPGVLMRVKAVVTDSVIMVIFMITASHIFGMFDQVHDYARISAFVFIFFLYDPIFTSSFGGTIGHLLMGISVRRERDPHKKILFPLALVRFVVKAGLGWISLLTVSGNKRGKAIHDMAVRSVVIFRDATQQ